MTTSIPTKRKAALAYFGGTAVSSEFIAPVRVSLNSDEIEAALGVLRSGALRQGAECQLFEEEFAAASEARHAFTTCNGTTALQLAYEALIEPGDEVLCPGYTFIATASMIIARGAVPVFCDIDADSFTIDPVDIEGKITPRTTAIAPVHLYGNPVDIEAVQRIAEKHHLAVIYDAAQAHLARYDGRGIGQYGDASIYSFYPTKNMTTGEGGMITTNDDSLAEKITLLRDHGMEPGKRYHHIALGYNYRLNDIAGALGRQQLRSLPERTAKRQENARQLTEYLSDIGQIKTPAGMVNGEHVYHQYTIRLDIEQLCCTRDEFAEYLKAEGVGSAVHYPTALTEQPIIRERVKDLPVLPECEKAGRETLCLPVHPDLTSEEVKLIAEAVRKIASVVAK